MKLAGLALAWLAYAVLHSALATLAVKDWIARRWPRLGERYRLAYNAVAVVTAMPLAWLVHSIDGDWLWRWSGMAAWLANGLAVAALAGVMVASRAYDMNDFLGLGRRGPDNGDVFVLSVAHRYVRHPWYAFFLVVIWTRDMTAPLLVSALAITLYFVVGSRLEERKLLVAHGERYRRYMACVPGLVPLPWKCLNEAEARELLR